MAGVRRRGKTPVVTLIGASVLLALGVALAGHGTLEADPQRQAEIEADWIQQEASRASGNPALTPAEDAAGAVDGLKDGGYGFHTGQDPAPWWQVDLGGDVPLNRVEVYNRCDAAPRADRLAVQLSQDGTTWSTVYQHSGPTFYGATDGKPLVVPLRNRTARYLRCTIPGPTPLHLDEVEVYGAGKPLVNIALRKPCAQSSLSQWSKPPALSLDEVRLPLDALIARAAKLIRRLDASGLSAVRCREAMEWAKRVSRAPAPIAKAAYVRLRWEMRRLMLRDPLLKFDSLLFVKRVNGSFNHMSDQYYGWWSRPGGALCILTGFRTDRPVVRTIATGLPPGSYLDPDLSYDGRKVLFAYCRYYPGLAANGDKTAKDAIPEDAFYHLYEANLDGTGLKRLTRGANDDFSGRYLPTGAVVFLSTRRGATVQHAGVVADSANRPDSYVRCGGDRWRPVAVYTLHTLSPDRKTVVAISPFENFEWTPNVCNDGRILYARWDYVDRDNMPYMKLWSTNPDGTNPQAVYGNHTAMFHSAFEARQAPNSRKILFTASAHHAVTGGTLILFDPDRGADGPEPLRRLTPEVCFPEVQGWPRAYYAAPYPLSEEVFLTSWGMGNLADNPVRGLGIYLGDADGNLELLYRDPTISSVYALPIQPRSMPFAAMAAPPENVEERERPATMVVTDVRNGLGLDPRLRVARLRIVAVPAKTQPEMNAPNLGVTSDDPGKCVLGTVPVEKDGSASFLVPPGVPLFFQALGEDGTALQTMRTVTYAQPGQTLSCVGCHEGRSAAVPNRRPLAMNRPPSRLKPGPDGSWPYRYDRLVQPVLDRACVRCHAPGTSGARWNLQGPGSYETLVGYGRPSLRDHVQTRYREGRSIPGQGAAATSALMALLRRGHHSVELTRDDMERLNTWMDTYAQRLGSFSQDQERELIQLKGRWQAILEP